MKSGARLIFLTCVLAWLGIGAARAQTADTTTALSASANSLCLGQPVTFTAVVTSNQPELGTPTGTVAFSDGATLIGTETLDTSGQASFSTASLDCRLAFDYSAIQRGRQFQRQHFVQHDRYGEHSPCGYSESGQQGSVRRWLSLVHVYGLRQPGPEDTVASQQRRRGDFPQCSQRKQQHLYSGHHRQ